ncbi:FUSC family protein [Bradyrhizobium sp. AUGA SZCCT0274]|uniref:FUSC family protein n=1 Tax=Bradyrhizobium sp. AUGA SZCCT0274 TaxID=2807670 RepID=UPI001BAB2234|nr:FUSC family protein [Bradyrhizobium sp. AUGA SZCCT0274]MBR1242834.1 FUSC family protein [Bradyrhizobium sp. AUGA SZCCT0274]
MVGFLKRVAHRLRSRRTQLALAIRVTVAAVVAYTIANALHLTLPLWAVLTSLIVTQMSVGRSLKATTDYMLGTIGGAIYGGALAVLIPHSSEAALLALLVLTVAPLAYLGSLNPSLTAATVTGVIVLLIPEMHHTSPLDSVIDRLIEVTVGASTGLAASFLVLPSRAHRQIRASAARVIELIAGAFSELLVGLTHGLDNEAPHRIQEGIGAAVTALHAMGQEAERERAARLSSGPDTGPLLRTILRLRHDVVMVGRECLVALPANVQARLDTPLSGVREAIDAHLRASAAALRSGANPPVIDPVQFALQGYAEEVASVRRDGLIRGLPGDVAERFFALGFSLEQMRQNIGDLDRCVAEWSTKPPAKAFSSESLPRTRSGVDSGSR